VNNPKLQFLLPLCCGWMRALPCCINPLRSQNHSATDWKRTLWIIYSNPTAKAGSPRAGCTGNVAGYCLHHPHVPSHVVIHPPLCYHQHSSDHLERKCKWHGVSQKQPTIKREGALTRLNWAKVWAAVLPLSLYSGRVFLLLPGAESNQYTTVSVYA